MTAGTSEGISNTIEDKMKHLGSIHAFVADGKYLVALIDFTLEDGTCESRIIIDCNTWVQRAVPIGSACEHDINVYIWGEITKR